MLPRGSSFFIDPHSDPDPYFDPHSDPQVADISVWGSPEEAAQLLLPRGSVLLGAAAETLQLPAKETPLGIVEVPPRNYYRCVSTALSVAEAGVRGGVLWQ